ncbi:LYR motif-containing protein At3g19508 isoform X2 [Arachis hypogaea]|uniref:LYR motif-containing protein At3g19508 isoform X2 n=1 Tax=Arachis hypogaea TaxID=3818 RepID=UPI000DECA73A|nr:LYR motif-containing protein At3g19508 isoform X2 [Arachis hypogaea]QHO36919.1 LYR motif-containing protein [Arachis hypogaea]
MEKALRAYAEVLRLVRRLPKESRGYYAKYARENFVNYRDVDPSDSTTLHDLFRRTYNHSIWLLHKYSVDDSAADKLKRICCGPQSLSSSLGLILVAAADVSTRLLSLQARSL